jgi:ribosomal protein S24E
MGNGLSKGQVTMVLRWQLGMYAQCTRRKERPRMRWLDDVENDLKKMEVKGWIEKMRNREQWRLVVEEAKAHPGLKRRVVGNRIY